MVWENRKYSLGCRNCGRNDTKHHGLGLCQPCYKIPEVNAAAKEGTLVEFDFTSLDREENVTRGTTVNDRGPKSVDEEEVTVLPPTNERRPGGFVYDEELITPVEEGPKLGLFDKLRGVGKKATKKAKEVAPITNEKRPRGATRRVSTADTLSDVWSGIGGLAVRTGHAPLGRYLQWQGTAAGEMLDEVVAGTIIDRKLFQPAVKARGKLDVLVALLGPPALILQIERNPAQAEMLLPMLKSAIRSSLPTMLPAMKKAQLREDKVNAAVKEMFPDLPDGVDPVDEVINQLFFGYVPNYPTSEEEPVNAEAL